jgi:hypothetical protein
MPRIIDQNNVWVVHFADGTCRAVEITAEERETLNNDAARAANAALFLLDIDPESNLAKLIVRQGWLSDVMKNVRESDMALQQLAQLVAKHA